MGPSCQRHQVNLTGPRTRARVARDCWSTLQTQGCKREWPWSACRTHGTTDPSASLRGQVFNTWALGHGPETPGTAGQQRGPLDPGPSRQRLLVEPAGHRTRVRVARDSWSTQRDLGHGDDSPGRAGRPRWPSDPGPSHPGQLVDPKGLRTWAPVARDSWLTRRALGCKRLWPGRAGRTRRHLEPRQSSLDSRSTPWALGSGPESPGTAVRPRVPSDQRRVAWNRCSKPWPLGQGPESPGMLVETVGPQAWA